MNRLTEEQKKAILRKQAVKHRKEQEAEFVEAAASEQLQKKHLASLTKSGAVGCMLPEEVNSPESIAHALVWGVHRWNMPDGKNIISRVMADKKSRLIIATEAGKPFMNADDYALWLALQAICRNMIEKQGLKPVEVIGKRIYVIAVSYRELCHQLGITPGGKQLDLVADALNLLGSTYIHRYWFRPIKRNGKTVYDTNDMSRRNTENHLRVPFVEIYEQRSDRPFLIGIAADFIESMFGGDKRLDYLEFLGYKVRLLRSLKSNYERAIMEIATSHYRTVKEIGESDLFELLHLDPDMPPAKKVEVARALRRAIKKLVEEKGILTPRSGYTPGNRVKEAVYHIQMTATKEESERYAKKRVAAFAPDPEPAEPEVGR